MAFADTLTTQRHFEIGSTESNYSVFVEENKKTLEADARQELDGRMNESLADYQTRPSWTVEDAGANHLYTLTMKVIFKP